MNVWQGMVRGALLLAATTPGIGVVGQAEVVSGAAPPPPTTRTEPGDYFPDAAASRIVTVTRAGAANAGVTVLTQAVAVKETGPRETVRRLGEVYAFSPPFIAVHRDEPTLLTFWNLQPDDEHDLLLAEARSNVLTHVRLPALEETAYLFTFHREGPFTFYCALHQPEMTGQILVLPPSRR
jgi:plastocyanin